MRVAFVSLFTPAHGETPARCRTRRTARLLADRGHEVTWCCGQWWGGDHATFEEDGITYRRVVADPTPGAFAAKLPIVLRRLDSEVVHAVNSPPGGAVAAGLSGSLSGVPVVVDWWSDRREDSRTLYRRIARAADAICTPTRTGKTRVREHGVPADRVSVVPESIDFEAIESADVDDRFDLVYSRRLDRHANVETFLLALAELRDRDWNAAVIGDGPERETFEQSARDLRIDDRVAFVGDLSREQRVEIFKGAHAIAQTATYEVFPTDLLWALACGCVGLVEYQADSSAHELVEGYDRGRLVTSSRELASTIVDIGDLPKKTIDDTFAAYDRRPVLEQYLERYRATMDEKGLL